MDHGAGRHEDSVDRLTDNGKSEYGVMSMRNPDSWLGVEVRHLAALDAIARERSFGGAGRRLGYTQSAISQQLALLERLVGARLVERSGGPRPVSLTPAGELLLRHGRRVVDQLAAARADLAAWSAGSAGELRVGTYHSVGAKILPGVAGRLAATLPDVHLALVETADEGELLRLVERGELDLTFMLFPLADGPFVAVELLRDPFLLLVGEDSPLGADGARATLAEVARLPLIAYDRVRDVTRPETHLRGTPRIVFRSNDDETIHGLVAAGMGAALLPQLSVDRGYPGVRVVELGAGLPPRIIGLAWHRDRDLLPAAREFVATTERVCAALAGEQPAGADAHDDAVSTGRSSSA
jgi:DNA-binding transcriptional LysR family regulator